MQKNKRLVALVRLTRRSSIRVRLDTNLDIERPALWTEALSSQNLASEKLRTRSFNLEIKHLLTLTEGHDNSEMQLRDLTVTAAML